MDGFMQSPTGSISWEDDRDTALQHLRSCWYVNLIDDPDDAAFYLIELNQKNSTRIIGKIHKTTFANEMFTKESILPPPEKG